MNKKVCEQLMLVKYYAKKDSFKNYINSNNQKFLALGGQFYNTKNSCLMQFIPIKHLSIYMLIITNSFVFYNRLELNF